MLRTALLTVATETGSAQPAKEPSDGTQDFVSARVVGTVVDVAGEPIAEATALMNRLSGTRIDGRIPIARGKTLPIHGDSRHS